MLGLLLNFTKICFADFLSLSTSNNVVDASPSEDLMFNSMYKSKLKLAFSSAINAKDCTEFV